MRTNIEIDDKLLCRALSLTGATTKKAVIEEALRLVVQIKTQTEAFKGLWGIGWEGNLEEMRTDEHLDWDPAWKESDRVRSNSVA